MGRSHSGPPPTWSATTTPPAVRCGRGARTTSSIGEGGGNEHGGRPAAPQPANRWPLTRAAAPSTRRPSPPPLARRAGGPSVALHEGLAPKGWRGAGEECAPLVGSWPSGTGTTRPPPRDRRGATGDQRGTAGNPPFPRPSPPSPPPRPADGRRPGREAAAPHPPQKGRSTQGGDATAAASAAARQVPPIGRALTPAVPAADRQVYASAQGRPVGRSGMVTPWNAAWRAGRGQSDLPWCPPGVGGGTDHGKETSPPPTPRSPPGKPPGVRRTGSPPPPPLPG